MGKLHKLRRAIERDPAQFYGTNRAGELTRVHGAMKLSRRWRPWPWSSSYRAFVASVLKDIQGKGAV